MAEKKSSAIQKDTPDLYEGLNNRLVRHPATISKCTTKLHHSKRKFFKNYLGKGGWPTASAKVGEGRGGYLGCKGAGHPGCRRSPFKDTAAPYGDL